MAAMLRTVGVEVGCVGGSSVGACSAGDGAVCRECNCRELVNQVRLDRVSVSQERADWARLDPYLIARESVDRYRIAR